MVSIRARTFLFGNMTRDKKKHQSDILSVRDIGPPCCKCCDDKSI